MKILLDIGGPKSGERQVAVQIARSELFAAYLHLASPEARNRTGRYIRRHGLRGEPGDDALGPVVPNVPVRRADEPPKLTIAAHLEVMRQKGMLAPAVPAQRQTDAAFVEERVMLAVPISDLAANLLRPCFHRDGLGAHRVFHFIDEPLSKRNYWCICFFAGDNGSGRLEMRRLRFDAEKDCVWDTQGMDLEEAGVEWAAAIVPLVTDGRALSAEEIAINDYDLRQIFGRHANAAIQYAYEGWYTEWENRVRHIVTEYKRSGQCFATFYHSILAMDDNGDIHIRQVEGVLSDLAEALAREGMVAAGVLDSGGSCALYDVWLASYLNHSSYFREARGAVLVFALTSSQRIPSDTSGTWIERRTEV